MKQLLLFFVLMASILSFFSVSAQHSTGIIYTQSCSGNDNNCVNLKLNPFYFDVALGEFEVYVIREGSNGTYDYFSEHFLQLGEVEKICGLTSGRYLVRVLLLGDCEENFEMVVGNSSTDYITLTTIKTECSISALHLESPPSSSSAYWTFDNGSIVKVMEINDGQNFSPSPPSWQPGLYQVFYRDGCNGYKIGSYEVTCQVEGDVRLTDEILPTSCSSQDGSLWIRNINICTATNGSTSMYLSSSAGQIFIPNSWSTFSGLGSDLYTLVVEDEFGCSADVETFDFRVEDSDVEVDIEILDACYATSNGSLEIWVGSQNQAYTHTSSVPGLIVIETGEYGTLYTAENLSGNNTYEFVVSTDEGCVFTYPITIGERAENQYWRGSVRTDVTHGCSSGALGSVNLHLGSIPLPATVSWDGGSPEIINSSNVSKAQLTTGEHCVEITSYCGVTTSRCFDVYNYEDDLQYTLRANSNCDAEFRFDTQHPLSSLISSFTLGDNNYTDIYSPIKLWSNSYSDLTVRFKNSDCIITETFFNSGSTPKIDLDRPCEDFEDGKITFRFTRLSDEVPVFQFNGNSVPLDPTLDNYVIRFDGLIAPHNYPYSLIQGDCVVEDGIRFTGSGIETVVSGHNIDQRLCEYNVLCQGEPLEGRTWTSEMGNRIPFRNKGDKCKTMFTCNGNDIESEKVKMKTVSVGVYNRLLNLARASGIYLPADNNDNDWYNTGSMHDCNRVRYCPADMQIKYKYHTNLTGRNSDITRHPETGCLTQDCFWFDSEGCPNEEYIPHGSIGSFYTPYNQGPCTEVKITLKQLVLWHDQLLLNRPDYDDDPDGNNLYRLANQIFTDLGPDATYIPTAPATPGQSPYQDPLLCTNVIFCRETLEVLAADNWRDASICEPSSGGAVYSPYCVVPLPGSDLSSCDGQDGGYSELLYSCKDEGTEFNEYTRKFQIYERAVVHAMSGCYPDETFNLELYPRLAPPGKKASYILQPYFAERSHKSFVTTIDQTGTKWSPKQFSTFGGYTSYSHNATQESESDLDFIPGTLAGSEHLTADDGFVLSLHKNEGGSGFYLLKDNQESIDPLLTFENKFVAYEAIADGFVMLTASSKGPSGYENLTLHRLSFQTGDSFTYDQQDLGATGITSAKLHLSNGEPIAILTSSGETQSVNATSVALGQTLQTSPKAFNENISAFAKTPSVSVAIDTSEQGVVTLRLLDSSTPQIMVSGKNCLISPLSFEDNLFRFLVSGATSISPYSSGGIGSITLDEGKVFEVVTSTTEIISSSPISDLKGATVREVYHVNEDLYTIAIDIDGEQQGTYFDKHVINNSPFVQSLAIDFVAGQLDHDALSARSTDTTESKSFSDPQNNIGVNFEWSLAPNPASQYLNIRLKLEGENNSEAELSIMTSTGQSFIEQEIRLSGMETKMISIDISMLPPGTYIAQLISPQIGLAHKQFIIHR